MPRKKKSIVKYKDNRYERTIKVAINKAFDNISSENRCIAKMVAEFSHQTRVEPGSFLVSKRLQYFVVHKVLSNHWVTGWFCPSKLVWVEGHVRYIPDLENSGKIFRKRLNNPFDRRPFVNIRERKFFLETPKVKWAIPTHYNYIAVFAD